MFEPLSDWIYGGLLTHARFCGQSVGTGLLNDDSTSIPILLDPTESVSFHLNSIAPTALASSGRPLTTAVRTSETD